MSDPAYRKGDFIKSYFASFDATGTPLIDDILSRIARAGKAHHSTEWWDESTDYGNDEAPSHLEMIQAAAQQAADRIEQLEALVETGCEHCTGRDPSEATPSQPAEATP